MLNFIEGTLAEKNCDTVVLNTCGLGYDIFVNSSGMERIGDVGGKVKLYICESVSMYGGGTVLYGFLTKEEKEAFLCFKENIPNTGAKKALEYIDKAGKSFADFKGAVSGGDSAALVGIFGFTKKTADKIIASLKDKISAVSYSGGFKPDADSAGADTFAQAKSGLLALGYSAVEAEAIISSFNRQELMSISVEEFLKRALRKINV